MGRPLFEQGKCGESGGPRHAAVPHPVAFYGCCCCSRIDWIELGMATPLTDVV